MNLEELIERLKEALSIAETLNEQQINEMTAFQDKSKTMEEYLQHIEDAKKAGNTKARCAQINGIRIPDECFRHVDTGHDLSKEDWIKFINTINPDKEQRLKSNSNPRYNGEPYLYTTEIDGKHYGYVLEVFPNKKPILVTAFWNDENSIESWIYNNSLRKPKSKKES